MSHSFASNLSGVQRIARSMPVIPRRPTETNANAALVASTRIEKVAIPATTEAPRLETRTCVAYSTDSVDSMFAAAMIADRAGRNNGIQFLGYSDEIPYTQLSAYPKIMLIAPGEVKREFVERVSSEGKSLTIFTYRGLLEGIEHKSDTKKNWIGKVVQEAADWDNLEVVRPSDDYYGPLDAKTSNTMIDVVHGWLQAREADSFSSAMTTLLVPMKRFVSLAFPIVADPCVGLGQGLVIKEGDKEKPDMHTEVYYKGLIYMAMPKVAAALRSHHPAHALDKLVLVEDKDAYMAQWKDNTNTLARSATTSRHRIKNVKGLGIVFEFEKATAEGAAKAKRRKLDITVKSMAVAERRWHDMLSMCVQQHTAFIGHEDMHGVRLWRVYAKNPDIARGLANSLGGEKVWSDGLCLRTYTRLAAK